MNKFMTILAVILIAGFSAIAATVNLTNDTVRVKLLPTEANSPISYGYYTSNVPDTNMAVQVATNLADQAAESRDIAATNAVRIMGDARWVGKSETNAFKVSITSAYDVVAEAKFIQDGDTLSDGLAGPDATNSADYVTLSQLAQALVGSYEGYLTTTIVASTNGLTPTNFAFKASRTLPAALGSITNEATAIGEYLGVWVLTNTTFTSADDGTAQAMIYANENQAGYIDYKPELYLFDTVRTALVEWAESAGSVRMTQGSSPVGQPLAIPYPAFSTNNACWLALRLKVTDLSGTPDAIMWVGPSRPSHFAIDVSINSLETDPIWLAAKAAGTTFGGDLKVSTNAHIDSAVGSSSYILGNTGIGTNNPAVKLHVLGEVRASDGISFGTSNFVMKSGTYLGSNGVYFVDGATTNWLLWP